MMGGVYENI